MQSVLPQNEQRLRVVVADDNVDNATTLAALLQNLGCDAVAVHDGASALLMLTTYDPQVFFLDLDMPLARGTDVARQVRAAGAAHCYLACMTGRAMAEGEAQDILSAGFDAVLIKPLELEQIATVLARAAGQQPDRAQGPR